MNASLAENKTRTIKGWPDFEHTENEQRSSARVKKGFSQ